MKKRILSVVIFLVLSLFSLGLANTVSAQNVCNGEGTEIGTNCDPLDAACATASTSSVCEREENKNPISGKDGIIMRVAIILSYVIGITCIIMIIIGGIRYMLSQGDSSSINSAKNQILYALVGLVVVIMARTIIVFVVNRI